MPLNKHYLILTSDSGFGHRNTANAIAKTLALRHLHEVVASVINPVFEQASSILLQKTERNDDRNVRDHPNWCRFSNEINDTRPASTLIEGTITLALYKNIKKLIGDMKPDAIVSINQMFNTPVGTVLDSFKYKPPFFAVVTDLADV